MRDAYEQSIASWIRFAGLVLVIAVLYWAQAVLVPVALALLITFVCRRRSRFFRGGSGAFWPS